MFYYFSTVSPVSGQKIENVRIIHTDEVLEVRGIDDPEYLAWVAEGNEAQPWE